MRQQGTAFQPTSYRWLVSPRCQVRFHFGNDSTALGNKEQVAVESPCKCLPGNGTDKLCSSIFSHPGTAAGTLEFWSNHLHQAQLLTTQFDIFKQREQRNGIRLDT
jgi:hypothetical protein